MSKQFEYPVNHTGSPWDNQTVISKFTFQNSSHIYYVTFLKSIHKTSPYAIIKHTYTNIRHTFLEELVHSVLPLLKEHKRLGYAGIVHHSI